MTTNKKIIIIGSGFSSLSAACYLAKEGHKVTVLEKNDWLGGRAQKLVKSDYTFDMGPTFYWMPDVFEAFFADFGKRTSEYYTLKRLSPAYRVYFGQDDFIDIAGDMEHIAETFKHIEPSNDLQRFIDDSEENYKIAINDLVYQPGNHLSEIITLQTAKKLPHFIKSIKSQVAKAVKDERLRKILEFPVLFLGSTAAKTPAFYNFMNYADFVLGTWHPVGGMSKVSDAMVTLAKELGVTFHTSIAVNKINTTNNKVTSISTDKGEFDCDILLSGADYAHTESLLPKELRQYSENYWERKTFSPAALLFYLGIDKKLKGVEHHTLFFDTNFDRHSKEIYESKQWPENPLFYASFPGKSDSTMCAADKEACTILVPLAPGLDDTPERRERIFENILTRLEQLTDTSIRQHIEYKSSYCINDFVNDFNSYKGNAYGLANTLLQTHILRPKLKSKKVDNLYFCGQLTVPGPGVPPSIISGKIVSELIQKN
ncbi:MAG: oleate hydratase [Saprospiraceae bacterium]|nr:oleate hydratase [Saprospiraceae bacterium]